MDGEEEPVLDGEAMDGCQEKCDGDTQSDDGETQSVVLDGDEEEPVLELEELEEGEVHDAGWRN